MTKIFFFINDLVDFVFFNDEGLDTPIGVVNKVLPQDTIKELYQCMYFVDDKKASSDDEWDAYFLDTEVQTKFNCNKLV